MRQAMPDVLERRQNIETTGETVLRVVQLAVLAYTSVSYTFAPESAWRNPSMIATPLVPWTARDCITYLPRSP